MNIQAIHLSRSYGQAETMVEALKDCSFSIETGERLSITGASGSGKSTLLHLMGGLDRPSAGKVLYDEADIYRMPDNQLDDFRLKNIGFVFQAYNLLPELTAYENIVLPILLDEQKPDKAYLEQIIEKLDLTSRLQHLPGQLSGGQQQRVALARALANKPQVLFCDEPTGNLDSKSAENVISLLNDTAEELNITLVVVTHNKEIAIKFPRLLHITDGLLGGDL